MRARKAFMSNKITVSFQTKVKKSLSLDISDGMIVVVCGSIGYGGLPKIRRVQSLLREKGFQLLDHISEEYMDYSGTKNFKDKRELAERIVKHDLEYIKKGDVIVAVSNGPSYGTAIEMFVAKQLGKHVILYSEEEVPTPWPIAFSDITASDLDGLVLSLKEFEKRTQNRERLH